MLRTTEPEEVMSAVRSLYDNRVYTRLRAANLHARVLTESHGRKRLTKSGKRAKRLTVNIVAMFAECFKALREKSLLLSQVLNSYRLFADDHA